MSTDIFSGVSKADGVHRDFGDDPDDFERRDRALGLKYNYQDQSWSNSIRGDYYDCKCSKCEGANGPSSNGA